MPDTRAAHDTKARPAVRDLVASLIRDVANEGMGDPDVLAFWFGEPDEVTPQFIREAGVASLARGETFYTQNFGIPPLRSAIASYVSRLHRATADDNVAVTASGMSALMLAVEALVAPGDRVVVITPLWPNLVEIPKILSANVECVSLDCVHGAMAARPRSPASCADARHATRARQFAEQSHRVDADPRRAAGDPRPLSPPRHLARGGRCLRAPVLS